MEYFTIDKIDAYIHAYRLGNEIWEIVNEWPKFERWTIGVQVTRSADSISANIAEGFGRYFKRDKIKFYRYSMGSAWETKDWLRKARDRQLIPPDKVDYLLSEFDQLPQMINRLIQFTNQKLKH